MQGKIRQCGYALLMAATTLLLASCGGGGGGGSDSSNSGGMSVTQAANFAKSISLAATSSMSGSAAKEISLSEAIVPAEGQQHESLEKTSLASVMINQAISASRTCTIGGALKVLGNISGSINDTGTGLILISATETISDWKCEVPLIINGDPYVSLSGQFSYVNGVPSTQQHLTINGGFKWGTSAAESCQIHLDTNFNRNGGGRTTGTVCSQTVDITF